MISKSPFPGMDPYLEGALWPDVHARIINVIAEMLAPKIAPKYVARVETYTVEDTNPASEVGITYPDAAIIHQRQNIGVKEPVATYTEPETVTEPDAYVPTSVTVHIPILEIRDTEKNRLITAIEILSPVNKREPGWDTYHKKKQKLHASGVHLLEIDLLRRGRRVVLNYGLPPAHYLFSLWRAGIQKTAVWANLVQQLLPVLPVPLKSPDPDVLLPLKQALDLIYERGMYHLSIDYSKNPPPPAFSAEESKWLREQVAAAMAG